MFYFVYIYLPVLKQYSNHKCFLVVVLKATGEATGEDVDSDSESDDDDDDVRVTIGDIKTGAPQYT